MAAPLPLPILKHGIFNSVSVSVRRETKWRQLSKELTVLPSAPGSPSGPIGPGRPLVPGNPLLPGIPGPPWTL